MTTDSDAAPVAMPNDQPGSVPDTDLQHGEDLIRSHASGTRGITVLPSSSFHRGKFGRLFRTLPGYDIPISRIDEIAALMIEEEPAAPPPQPPPTEIGQTWAGGVAPPEEEPPTGTPMDNRRIPAAYTYLGQFLDHDITFDPASSLTRRTDPDSLHNFRTPRLDLDSMYGRGPDDQPYLYDQRPGRRGYLAIDERQRVTDLPRVNARQAVQISGKVPHHVALIGDARNDENILVAQMHLTFIKFHNKVMDDLSAGKHTEHLQSDKSSDRFAEAQRIVRWHYQYMILSDFLRKTVGDSTHDAVLPSPVSPGPLGGAGPQAVNLEFYNPHDGDAFMPVEFSVGAYRFGHSQVRSNYRLNTIVRSVRIFVAEPSEANQLEHLGGHREFPDVWQIEWPRFVNMSEATDAPTEPDPDVQFSRRIDMKLAGPLHSLPADVVTGVQSLAARNLRRGKMLSLPTGQDVARRMGAPVLTGDDVGLPGLVTPLWPYVLGEAALLAAGEHLGPVGGRIVAEVIAGLVKHDSTSFLRVNPGWRPFLGSVADRFYLADLLAYTGFGIEPVSFQA